MCVCSNFVMRYSVMFFSADLSMLCFSSTNVTKLARR